MGNYQRSSADGQEGCRGDVASSHISCGMILQMTMKSHLHHTDCTHALHSSNSLCIPWLLLALFYMFHVL